MAKRGLGKGLGAFFGEEVANTKETSGEKVSRSERKEQLMGKTAEKKPEPPVNRRRLPTNDKEELNMMMNRMNPNAIRTQRVEEIMSRDPLALSPMMRAGEALARLRQVGVPRDFMANCYVVDERFCLLGLVTVRDLIMAPTGKRLDQFMAQPAARLHPEDDQERAVEEMDRLDQVELPVVDEQDRLVGTVTADDAMDVMQAEATEDMERMAAMAPSERPYLRTRVWDLYRSRIFWLLLLMLSAAFTGAIITHFENALAAQVVLTAFIPMLMDTGGNCGSQSSVTVIRGLSLGEIKSGDWLRVMGKELQVGLLCGGTLAAVNMARLCLLGSTDFPVALAVSLTLIVTVTCAKLLGCCLPILASQMKLDPAVMASPLITTIADAVSLFVYFRIAVCLLKL